MDLVERDVTVVNELGLHARPAAELVKVASRFEADLTLCRDGMEVNAKSILGVMTLAAERGAVLQLRARGADASDAVEALAQLVAKGFGE